MHLGFKRCVEDFVCEVCGANVSGNGYTNHCPKCLWSKCVDINPGDRASKCGGMMKPVGFDGKMLTHKCEKCGKTKRQKLSDNDDMDVAIAISANDEFVFG